MNKPREEEKEIDRKLYEILGYEKCSEADQAIEKIKDLLSSQLKEVEERIFQDVNIPAEVCKYIREKILAEVEKLV